MHKTKLNDFFGTKPDIEKEAIHEQIVELERRSLWISTEMNDPVNFSPDTCRYSEEMMESLEDEKNLLDLLANVMYRREKIVSRAQSGEGRC